MMVPAGAEREFNTPIADELIRNGRAVEVKESPAPLSRKALKKLAKKSVSNANR